MKHILFITGNERKVWQATESLRPFGISVEAQDIDVVEIQSHDPLKIAHAKAEAAFAIAQTPLIICDHFWSLTALNGFPGGYMKDMNGWFQSEDFVALLQNKQDKSAVLTETIIYTDGDDTQVFSAEYPAHVINESRGVGTVPCESVVVFDGHEKTIAQYIDEGKQARDIAKTWQQFGQWYTEEN